MPTWKKVIVSGSQAHLAAVTASIAFQVGTNQFITTSPATTFLSGSFSGSFNGSFNGTVASASVTSITDTTSGIGPYYITFKDATTGHPVDRIDSTGLTYNATNNALTSSIFLATNNGIGFVGTASVASNISPAITNNTDNQILTATGGGTINGEANLTFDGSILTVAGTIAANGASGITTNQTTFPIVTSATNVTIAATATNPTITLGNGAGSNVIIPGNLTVNGNTTVVNTTNVEVKDSFILLASGSVTTGQDGGIIVQSPNTNGTGSAFYWEGTDSRWAVAQVIPASSTSITTPNSYVVTVSGSNIAGATPGGPFYGGATNAGIGNMFIDTGLTGTSDNNIWIYA